MRSRVFADETTTRSYHNTWTTSPPQPSNVDRLDLATRVVRRDEMLDVVTPRFYSIRNKGGIICSPMYRETLYSDVDHTTIEQVGRKGTIAITRHRFHEDALLGGSSLLPLLPSTDAMDELFAEFSRETDLAIMRAHAEVDVSEMQLLATAGELPETLAWIRSLVQRGVKLTRAFKRRADYSAILRSLKYAAEERPTKRVIAKFERYVDLIKARKARLKELGKDQSLVDDFSNLWLEYRYALRPLVGDLQNALKALSKIIDKRRMIARGHEYSGATSERIESTTLTEPSQIVKLTAKVTETEKIKARSGVLYALEESLLSLVNVLGLDQPVESIWELIPFSFIVDWFFSVGDLLNSWFKSSGLSVLTSWVSLQVERSTVRKITNCEVYNYNGYVWQSDRMIVLGSSHSTATWRWRVPNPELPLLPRLDIKLDLAKIIDLGMIGRAMLGGQIPEVTKRS